MLKSRLLLWGPVVVQMTVIFIASSIPYLDISGLPGGFTDKYGHGIGYALLGALLLRALSQGRLRGLTWWRAIAAIVLATLYGVVDECHQWFVPGRTADALDVVADAVGASAAVLLGGVAAAVRGWGILHSSPPPERPV